jgi:predicted Zn-dependent protease
MIWNWMRRLWQWRRSTLFLLGFLLCVGLTSQPHLPGWTQASLPLKESGSSSSPSDSPNLLPNSLDDRLDQLLPSPQAHPLPTALAQWQPTVDSDDYFLEVMPTPLGYLMWTEFPVKVFVEPLTEQSANIGQASQWIQAVQEAIEAWNLYLPLQQVETSEVANILIWRSAPPLQGWRSSPEDGEAGDRRIRPQLPRVRAAEARYHLFLDHSDSSDPPRIAHQVTIHLSPNQTVEYLKATARHELGHALGIWGHSPTETDVMYFSQVRTPPPISERDINTLKRIYQQPTRLGWAID